MHLKNPSFPRNTLRSFFSQLISSCLFILFFLLISFNSFSQSKRLKKIYQDSTIYVTRFDSSYIGLLMQYGSKTTTSTHDEIHPGNNALNKYNKPGSTSRKEWIVFPAVNKYLPPQTQVAKRYFELVPKANRKFKTHLFWAKGNKRGLFVLGGSVVLFAATLPFTGGLPDTKHHLRDYRLTQINRGFGICAVSSIGFMYLSYSLSPRPLKKAVQYYNEGIEKVKANK